MTEENKNIFNDLERQIGILISKYGGSYIGADVLGNALQYLQSKRQELQDEPKM